MVIKNNTGLIYKTEIRLISSIINQGTNKKSGSQRHTINGIYRKIVQQRTSQLFTVSVGFQ
jgi:hypothetical protein